MFSPDGLSCVRPCRESSWRPDLPGLQGSLQLDVLQQTVSAAWESVDCVGVRGRKRVSLGISLVRWSLFGFSTSSSASRLSRGRAPRMTSDNFTGCHRERGREIGRKRERQRERERERERGGEEEGAIHHDFSLSR